MNDIQTWRNIYVYANVTKQQEIYPTLHIGLMVEGFKFREVYDNATILVGDGVTLVVKYIFVLDTQAHPMQHTGFSLQMVYNGKAHITRNYIKK